MIKGDAILKSFTEREKPMLPRKQKKAFNEFYKAARYNEILDPKTTLLNLTGKTMRFYVKGCAGSKVGWPAG